MREVANWVLGDRRIGLTWDLFCIGGCVPDIEVDHSVNESSCLCIIRYEALARCNKEDI